MDREIREVVRVLQAFENLEGDTGEILLQNVTASRVHVKDAAQRVGMEYGKLQGSSELVRSDVNLDSKNLTRAKNSVDDAMQDLMGDRVINPSFKAHVKKVNDKYRLGASARMGEELIGASVASPLAILSYFKGVTEDIASNNTENGSLTQKGKDLLRNYLIEFIQEPGIDQFFRSYASIKFLGAHMESLGTHLPVTAVIGGKFAKKGLSKIGGASQVMDAGNLFKNKIEGILDDVFEYLDLNVSKNKIEYESEETNLGGKSLQVKVAQTAILMIERWLNIINFEVGGLRIFLKPANDKLTNVNKEMGEVLNNKEIYKNSQNKKRLLKRKIDWMGRLGQTRSLLEATEENKVQFGNGVESTPENINEQFKESFELFNDLQEVITNRVVREGSDGEPEEVPLASDQILEKADKYLKSFVLGKLAIFDDSNRETLLAELQSIKRLLKTLKRRDREERSIANNFIRSVEKNPLFDSVIKPSWDAMMKGLKGSPVGSFIFDDLAKGDLSSLATTLANVAFGSQKLSQVFGCSEASDDPENDEMIKLLSGGDDSKMEDAKKTQEEIDETTTALKNKNTKYAGITEAAQKAIKST